MVAIPPFRQRPAESPSVPPLRAERRHVPRGNRTTVTPGPTFLTLNHGSTFLVCDHDGSIRSRAGQALGLYADDTRFLSRHELMLNDRPLRCLAAARLSFRQARWTYTADSLPSPHSSAVEGRVTVTLDRLVSNRRLHENFTVRCYGDTPPAMLALQLESDFADLFEVRTERWQRRSGVNTTWSAVSGLDTRYQREDFVRQCRVRMTPRVADVGYANGALRFPVELSHPGEWRICLQYDLVTVAGARPALVSRTFDSGPVDREEGLHRRWQQTVARATPSDLRMRLAFDQAVDDFGALRLFDHDFTQDVWIPAAGIPWFVAVFGRDSILASIQAMPAHPLFAIGALQKLAQWQSRVDDPDRDAEPGKMCHEMRVGEWAHFRTIPHSPYYGTADATPLYLMLLAEAHRWLGEAELLQPFRATAERCLEWIDRHGDLDGDGFQEYRPRSPAGYRNQGWRDAEDGVLDEFGEFPRHPIAMCEMQAYVYAAKRDVAEVFAAWGDLARADALRQQAAGLRQSFNERFWIDDLGTVAFALDGDKHQLRTQTSNPGHCLWLGMLDGDRAGSVATRLMAPDLFNGFGLRTLSSAHAAYDPHSYQRGSVWPHDTVIAAAGMRRCGRDEDAWRLLDGILSAASAFEGYQLPELFAGLQRRDPDAPVPYERANVPQAWAAGSIFHAVRILLGLEPDVPNRRLYIDPALPPWCPQLRLENVRIGRGRLTIEAHRQSDGTSAARVEGALGDLEVVAASPPWFAPG